MEAAVAELLVIDIGLLVLFPCLFLDAGDGPKKRGSNKAQKFITLIGLILFFIVMIYITKFYSLL